MPLIGTLIDFEPNVTARSSDVDENFNAIRAAFNDSAVLTDVAKTINVTHNFAATQTFGGGVSIEGGAQADGRIIRTAGAGLLLQGVAGGSYDFGLYQAGGAAPALTMATGTRNLTAHGTWTVAGVTWMQTHAGVGVAPSTDWNASFRALQLGSDGALWANANEAQSFWSTGVRYTTGGYVFTANGASGAASVSQASGNISFLTAPGGAAGTAATLTQRGQITNSGIFAWGTTVTTGGGAGDIIQAYNASHRWANSAGTGTIRGIMLTNPGTGNVLRIGVDGDVAVGIGAVSSFANTGAGDLVLARNMIFAATDRIIHTNTADGSDTYRVTMSGGGDRSTARGGFIDVYGNDHATNPGDVILASGATTGRIMFIANNGNEVGRVTGNGIFAWGTTVTSGAGAGDVVLANGRSVRAANAAGTDTAPLIGLDANSNVTLGGGYDGIYYPTVIGDPAANIPAGSAARNGRFMIDTTNNRWVYYANGQRFYLQGTAF